MSAPFFYFMNTVEDNIIRLIDVDKSKELAVFKHTGELGWYCGTSDGIWFNGNDLGMRKCDVREVDWGISVFHYRHWTT